MSITAIDTRTYNEMLQAFSDFAKDISETCHQSKLPEAWLDNQNVCQILGIKKRTLQYYRDNRIIGFTQIGHKCYYRREDVQSLIDKSTSKNT